MSLKQTVRFDFIRYANCWEDADILFRGLAPSEGKKILSIASAGDNSFLLLKSSPELLVAVDVNKTQLYLTELKKICIKNLDREEVLKFLGFKHSSDRIYIFNSIKRHLSPDCKTYWEKQVHQLERGIIYQGKFEKYFILFSNRILPFIHARKTISKLFEEKDAEAQDKFYNKKWNNLRWKWLFKIFFSKYIMGKYGRDPKFLDQVKVPVSQYIYGKAAIHLKSIQAQNNFMLRFNLTGRFANLLPPYLLKENFEVIKKNIDKLVLFEGFAEDAFKMYGKFNYMNLSNIFEYMDDSLFYNTSKTISENLEKGGRIAYWNLMVPRRISEILSEEIEYKKELSEQLSAIDRGFFYNQFIIEEAL